MTPTPRRFLRPVEPALGAIEPIKDLVMADLDEEIGGVGWWDGHTDWRSSAMMAEYLLGSLSGINESLVSASLQVETYSELEYADRSAKVANWNAAARNPEVNFSYRDMMVGNDAERTREIQIKLMSDHCIFHLAQALDRMAAAVTLVGALGKSVVTMDWPKLTRLSDQAARQVDPKGTRDNLVSSLGPVGSPGRQLQDRLLTATTEWAEHGPEDWLPWMLATRNTATHRALSINWHVTRVEKGAYAGMVQPFIAQPDWPETKRMADGTRGQNPFVTMFLMKEPSEVMRGLLGSVVALVSDVAAVMGDVWIARRADPSLLIQHGRMSPYMFTGRVLAFPGYGADLKWKADAIATHPDQGRRMRAAMLMKPNVRRWDADPDE